jgi:hypothetical protein
MQSYKNEFVALYVPTLTVVSYTIQTADNINSVYIYNNTVSVQIGINNPDYITGTWFVKPGENLLIEGQDLQKINAPLIIYADNIGPNNPPQTINIIIKRYV